jgi:acyl-CoA thioester hydrolase
MAANPFDTPYRGGLVGRAHHYALTVFFEDTDAYGIVYYANYLKFMERARSDMLRSVDIDQAAELASSGSAYAVVEANLKYRRPARLSDDIKVVSTVRGVRASAVDIQQRVMRGDELLVDGLITAAFLDGQGRPRRHPRDWVQKFERFVGEE